jgi:SlyX protein
MLRTRAIKAKPMDVTMTERLIEIETKVAYQEHTISELNDVVYRQQQQIDALERICNTLSDRVQNIAELSTAEKGGHEKPPHY